MSKFLSIVSQPQESTNEEVLRSLCARFNFSKEIGVFQNDFVNLPAEDQDNLVRKFYFDHLPINNNDNNNNNNNNNNNIDFSIGNAIQRSAGITMENVISDGKTEMKISTDNESEKKKSINLWENFGYFDSVPVTFSIEKANLSENTLFYLNQG